MAFIYSASQKKPLAIAMVHDPDESVYYTFRYRAPDWTSLAEKKQSLVEGQSGDVVRPLSLTGFYAECISTGVTGAVEPTWGSAEDDLVDDGSVQWEMHTDDFELETGDTISSSEWSVDGGVTIDNDGVDTYDTYTRVSAVPDGVSSFILTNQLTINRANGFVEVINRSVKIKVKDR